MSVDTSVAASDQLLSISDVAIAFGLPVSTLRYYDKIGLVPAPHRRSRVRYYDREALTRLAYVRLWHADGALSIEQTTDILASSKRAQRNDVIERSRAELAERIALLTEAHELLSHMALCPYDSHLTCPIISTFLAERVDTAAERLAGHAHAAESAGPAIFRVAASLTPATPPPGDAGSAP